MFLEVGVRGQVHFYVVECDYGNGLIKPQEGNELWVAQGDQAIEVMWCGLLRLPR